MLSRLHEIFRIALWLLSLTRIVLCVLEDTFFRQLLVEIDQTLVILPDSRKLGAH